MDNTMTSIQIVSIQANNIMNSNESVMMGIDTM